MDKMSDETGPALSRRALREQRRAEAEAQLARQAEGKEPKAAEPIGKPVVVKPSVTAPAVKPQASQPKAAKPPVSPAPAKPAVSKPTPAPAAAQAAKPAAKEAPAKVVPAAVPAPEAKPEAAKTAPAKVEPARTEPAKAAPAAAAPIDITEVARSRRATGGEIDAVPQRAERTSLQRARDRENLRTRRRLEQEVSELSAKEPSPADDPAPLTRKQMRLQTLGAAAGNTMVEERADGAPAADSAPESDAAVPASGKPAAAKTGPAADKPAAAKPATSKPAPAKEATPSKPAASASQMSVEDALALRRRTGGAAPVDPALIQPAEDLGDVDLEVLAQQRELAARAAIISRRAAERQRLEESNSQRAGQRRSDPFTGSMNMLRDEDIEKKLVNTGISGPETRGFHISMTDQGTIVDGPGASSARTKTSASGAPAPAAKPAEKPAAATPAQAASRESKSLGANPAAAAARAGAAPAKPGAFAPAKPMATGKPAAAARATPKAPPLAEAHGAADVEPRVSHPPVRAVRAQGLEPLDAQTAGMRRANNMYLMVIAALSVGGAALVAGLIMILNSN
ncbi:hypothetical protein [Paeniglutamicibacter sp. NPDC091659]|uniref:hypothetical protein n=1 Tax=Paeniglutamicibacter sp. NPDC091659 TaxID=3364389 RepID=UPI003812DD6B